MISFNNSNLMYPQVLLRKDDPTIAYHKSIQCEQPIVSLRKINTEISQFENKCNRVKTYNMENHSDQIEKNRRSNKENFGYELSKRSASTGNPSVVLRQLEENSMNVVKNSENSLAINNKAYANELSDQSKNMNNPRIVLHQLKENDNICQELNYNIAHSEKELSQCSNIEHDNQISELFNANNPSVVMYQLEDDISTFNDWNDSVSNISTFNNWNDGVVHGDEICVNESSHNPNIHADQISDMACDKNQCKQLSIVLHDVFKRKELYFNYVNMKMKSKERSIITDLP